MNSANPELMGDRAQIATFCGEPTPIGARGSNVSRRTTVQWAHDDPKGS
jgi:hypothetical protein